MVNTKLLFGILCTIWVINCVPTRPTKRALQPLPFSSEDRWIIDASGAHVPYVGINWPGAADTMLPEGLQYQSISNIVSKVSQTGFNAVRLTFAIEMVDDILDNGGDVSLNTTLTNALGAANGTIVLGQILANNPQFNAGTTRLQVQILVLEPRKPFSDILLRSLMQWLLNLLLRTFISIWITMFRKLCGVVP